MTITWHDKGRDTWHGHVLPVMGSLELYEIMPPVVFTLGGFAHQLMAGTDLANKWSLDLIINPYSPDGDDKNVIVGHYKTLDEAKAAAQADVVSRYPLRALAALGRQP